MPLSKQELRTMHLTIDYAAEMVAVLKEAVDEASTEDKRVVDPEDLMKHVAALVSIKLLQGLMHINNESLEKTLAEHIELVKSGIELDIWNNLR